MRGHERGTAPSVSRLLFTDGFGSTLEGELVVMRKGMQRVKSMRLDITRLMEG